MAVYTKLNKKDVEEILSNYNLGKLDEFKGIEEGIENTNYFLLVNKKKFILTIYEKRVKSKDLPFFSESAVQICPKGPSCCTPDMELRMRHQSSLEYREAVNNKTTVMANPFHTKASKLHGKYPCTHCELLISLYITTCPAVLNGA